MGNTANLLCGTQDGLHLKLLIGSPERLYGGPADLEQVLPQLDRNVPVEVHTGLQEGWLTRDRDSGVYENHGVLRPALLVPVETLRLLALGVLDPTLNSHLLSAYVPL